MKFMFLKSRKKYGEKMEYFFEIAIIIKYMSNMKNISTGSKNYTKNPTSRLLFLLNANGTIAIYIYLYI
ncbi:hypothetical protein DERP_009684 [Dermatophagoides pteronyssinus]|uniref:Uncharacterized protein n=1 Tax=Dermatophagoides pteronyssinus TaxID=6956 RepID=A0ABQ8JAJ2_DERPT|nr:hypothetical protein DERP_009684 [Dermatophagoides pteronyssinus]